MVNFRIGVIGSGRNRLAFAVLAPGPLLGAVAMRSLDRTASGRLQRDRVQPAVAEPKP